MEVEKDCQNAPSDNDDSDFIDDGSTKDKQASTDYALKTDDLVSEDEDRKLGGTFDFESE